MTTEAKLERALKRAPRRAFTGIAAELISGWFGCGHSPVAPGTAGSLGALPIAWLLSAWTGWPPAALLIAAAVLFPIAVWAAGLSARKRGTPDPAFVVVDEVLGQWIALAGATVLNWKAWLAAVLLFRLFDIVKPPPARQLEALPGGWGIVMDDVMAGAYAALVLFLAGCFNLY
jgi:phosphatidylglycerophosphatase A